MLSGDLEARAVRPTGRPLCCPRLSTGRQEGGREGGVARSRSPCPLSVRTRKTASSLLGCACLRPGLRVNLPQLLTAALLGRRLRGGNPTRLHFPPARDSHLLFGGLRTPACFPSEAIVPGKEYTPCPLSCGTFEEPTKVKVSGPQPARPKVAPDMRSTKEGENAPSKSRASPSDVPQASESNTEKSVSWDSKLTDMDSNLGAWEVGMLTWSPSTWIAQAQVSETRMAKAQAWETLALARITLQPKPSVTELATVTTLEQESSELVNRMSRESSEGYPPRQLWASKVEYILAIMSYLLMPSGVLRFASGWVHKGSCSFFIAYILMLLGIGIPLLFLEMAVGQRAQQSSADMWKNLSPWFGGVGYSMVMVCFITNTYLNVFNSWILFYMSHIFYFVVPWDQCPLQRNSSNFDPECEQATSYTYFWYRKTLKASDRIEDGGQPSFSLGMFLFLSFCLICAFLVNGIKSIGKVLFVLLLVPYSIIVCFLIRTLSMDGAEYGLKHLLILKVASISDLTIWCHAGIQVLFDIGLGFGPIVSLASHVPDFNNCMADAFLMALFKIITLLMTTPFLLSILGFWATTTTHHCCKK